MTTKKISRNKENGKTIIDLGYGRIKEFPLDEPTEELTYDLLQFFFNSTPNEIALALGWDITRVKKNLERLNAAGLVTLSHTFTKKLSWIRPPKENAK